MKDDYLTPFEIEYLNRELRILRALVNSIKCGLEDEKSN